MNEVRKTHDKLVYGVYQSPEVKVVLLQFEGILCGSVGSDHEDFGDGGSYDL